MSEMEAIYGTYRKFDTSVLGDEELHDAGERLGKEFIDVDGVVYEIEILEEIDAYGFRLGIEPSDTPRFVCLWYNGGAGMHEVVEEAIRDIEDKGVKGRFWVLGPVVDEKGVFMWGVSDGHDLPGQRRNPKPPGYQEFWPTEGEAEKHRDELNRTHKL